MLKTIKDWESYRNLYVKLCNKGNLKAAARLYAKSVRARAFTDLKVLVQFDLTIHISVDFAQYFMKLFTRYFLVTKQLWIVKKKFPIKYMFYDLPVDNLVTPFAHYNWDQFHWAKCAFHLHSVLCQVPVHW